MGSFSQVKSSMKQYMLFLVVVIVCCCLKATAVIAAENRQPPTDCKDNLDCYIAFSNTVMQKISNDVEFWSTIYTIGIITVVVCGVTTTLMLGMQNDSTKHWTRPVGLITATVGAAITTLVTAFHVQDNIDKLLDVRAKIRVAENELQHRFGNTPENQRDELLYQYSTTFDDLQDQLARLKGSAGHLNIDSVGQRAGLGSHQ